MNRRMLPVAVVALAVMVAGMPPASARAGRRLVGTDPAGDWGDSVASGLGPVGDVLGQDLVGASIGSSKKTIDFAIKVTKLPLPAEVATIPTGYFWDFKVNGIPYEINTCEPDLIQGCPQPPVGALPFMVFQCLGAFGACTEVGGAAAVLDAKTSSIVIPVARDLLMATPGSVVQGNTTFGAVVYSYVGLPVVGSTDGPGDQLTTAKTFTVP